MKLFTPLILIGACILAYFMYISPTYSDVQNLISQKNSYDSVLQDAKNISTKRDQIMASYNSIPPDDLTRLAKIVPVNFNSVTFVNHLNTIAENYGLSIDSMEIVEQDPNQQQVVAPSANSYQTESVSFVIKGPYPELMNFLRDMESGLYLVDVTSLSVKRDQSSKTDSSFEMDATLNTYSLN